MRLSVKIVCGLMCALCVSVLSARSPSRTSEVAQQYIVPQRGESVYVPSSRQGGVLFVEDICGTFGPGTSPDPLWQGTLDAILGTGNYGWYTTTSAGDNGPDSLEMMNYDLVIWNCYDYWWQDTTALTGIDQLNLESYFYNQGGVWLIGQDLLWSGVPMTWMQSFFHLASATQDYLWDEPDVNLHGLVEIDSIAFLATSDYASNNFFTDALVPDAYAHVVLEDTDNSQDVGIFYPGQGDWQAAFWTIDGRNPNPNSEWVQMVTQMLEAFGITGIQETPGHEVARRLWLTISPDPVVQTTTVSYNVPLAGHVQLKIFNRAGQHVVTLIDEQKPAGTYTLTWNARDKAGVPVANGVYFVRLECNELVNTASLVVVQ
ncbi:T9SS type A sorting domain-containing protein [candidate division WOR-3 bacterium]|nr:T9SS type A sorting domain-containing protein [candidate division WOR-3 bacterium]